VRPTTTWHVPNMETSARLANDVVGFSVEDLRGDCHTYAIAKAVHRKLKDAYYSDYRVVTDSPRRRVENTSAQTGRTSGHGHPPIVWQAGTRTNDSQTMIFNQ
jgi:hypothetical protein